jgi:Fe2+ or Zn2+ uptake regulation protein
MGTVYRNLALLESLGEIVRISSDDTSDRFDGNACNHYHFACEVCKRVDDVPVPVDLKLDEAVCSALGARVNRQTAMFFGVCKSCLKTS